MHGTPLPGQRGDLQVLGWALGALADGRGSRAVARVFAGEPHPVRPWRVEGADHLHAFSRYVLHDLHVAPVQMDELFAGLRAGKDGAVTETEGSQRWSRSPHWGWIALDPVPNLVLILDVGERTLAMARGLGHQRVPVLAPDGVPLVLTAGQQDYFTALLTHVGPWVQLPRRQATGPMPKPRWIPRPGRRDAQGGKTVRRQRRVRRRHRVMCGTLEALKRGLAPHGWQINASFVERLNRDCRPHGAALGPRVHTVGTHAGGWRQQLALFPTDPHFCGPQASRRRPRAAPEPTTGTGLARQWRPCTAAMAAGLPDRGWTLRDVLRYRGPPGPPPQVP